MEKSAPDPGSMTLNPTFQGTHLAFLQDYIAGEPPSTSEYELYQALSALFLERMTLSAFTQWLAETCHTLAPTPDAALPVFGVMTGMLQYLRHPERYNPDELLERLKDYWDWMSQGIRKSQERSPLVAPRACSIVEEDLLTKIRAYLAGQVTLEDLLYWTNNPLLLWEMLEQAASDPQFAELVIRVHRILTLFTESRDTREPEIYDLLAHLTESLGRESLVS